MNNNDFSFEIVEHLAVLGTNQRGWTKELNLVSWNKADPKYDIRDWDPTHEMMGRGVTLKKEEMAILAQVVSGLDF